MSAKNGIKYMRKKTFFLIITVLVYCVSSVFAENIGLQKINLREPRRTLYYNWMIWTDDDPWEVISESDNPIQAGTTFSQFGISMPVKDGDIIEVTFTGSIHGNICATIAAAAGSPCTTNHNQLLMSAWSEGVHLTWTPFTLKSIFTATGNGTATFRLSFWQTTPYLPALYSEVYIHCVLAQAELVN